MSSITRRGAWTITALAGVAYLILAPASPDLAAAAYRSDLFSRVGFSLWDNSWYGGHHLPAYSLMAPALGAAIPPRVLAAVSMTVATALFAALIDGRFAARATRIAAPWFALGAAISLLSSRVPFDLGLALGLAALLAAQRARPLAALALALLTSLASPVAGGFLALACLAWALAAERSKVGQRSQTSQRSLTGQRQTSQRAQIGQRRLAAALVLAALVPIALLAIAFPEGGTQPFVASAFYPALAAVLALAALIPAEHRILRAGAFLYALAMIASYAVPTAVGGNADRLGALAAGPLAACALASAGRMRRLMLLALAAPLLYWQANAPIADFVASASSRAVDASYYAPLLDELRALDIGYGRRPARTEVVATAAHWEARYLAPAIMLARGWERQLDRYRNALFYSSAPLRESAYRAWLAQAGVSYVALPDAPLDYSAKAEARLLTSARPPVFLHEIFSSRHWRLFAVQGATPLAQPPATLTAIDTDSFTLSVPRAGSYDVKVHFSSYWALAEGHGCVKRASGDWTQVRAPAAGSYRVVISFSFARVFDRGPRCR